MKVCKKSDFFAHGWCFLLDKCLLIDATASHPAEDAGKDTNGIAYGEVTDDIDKAARTLGSYDIGADEK